MRSRGQMKNRATCQRDAGHGTCKDGACSAVHQEDILPSNPSTKLGKLISFERHSRCNIYEFELKACSDMTPGVQVAVHDSDKIFTDVSCFKMAHTAFAPTLLPNGERCGNAVELRKRTCLGEGDVLPPLPRYAAIHVGYVPMEGGVSLKGERL